MNLSIVVFKLLKTFDETPCKIHFLWLKSPLFFKINLSQTVVERQIKLIRSVVLNGFVKFLFLVTKRTLLFYLCYWSFQRFIPFLAQLEIFAGKGHIQFDSFVEHHLFSIFYDCQSDCESMIKALSFLYLFHLLLRVENDRWKKDAAVWLRFEHCDLKCLFHAQLP